MENKNLYQRINSVMTEVQTVFKTANIPVTKTKSYSAVEHDEVTKLLHNPLIEAGIIVNPYMESCESIRHEGQDSYGNNKVSFESKVWAHITFVNIDNPEERLSTRCFAHAFDSGDKGPGKAFSMAIKNCYLKTFMLESADKEESRDEQKHIPQKQASSTRKALTPTDSMLRRLFAITTNSAYTPEDVKIAIKKRYGIDSSKDLSSNQYKELCDDLENGEL